jgi:putative ABC transport system permease protein
VALGGVIGEGVVLAGGSIVRPLLFATSPRDPVVLAGVALSLLLVATLACLLPARRTMRVDINVAIREE